MYTIQSLWTIARERLDVVVVVFANSAYRILNVEFTRTGSGDKPGSAAARLLDLAIRSSIGWRSAKASVFRKTLRYRRSLRCRLRTGL